MVLAVLEAHGGLKLGQYDVYLNVAGGLRVAEPAADLAAAAALISSLTGAALPHDAVYFGEIALSGSVRAVAHTGLRLKEAAKLGFASAFGPPSSRVRSRQRQDRPDADPLGRLARRAGRSGRSRGQGSDPCRSTSGKAGPLRVTNRGGLAIRRSAGRRRRRSVAAVFERLDEVFRMPSYLDLAVLAIVLVSAFLSHAARILPRSPRDRLMGRGRRRRLLFLSGCGAVPRALYPQGRHRAGSGGGDRVLRDADRRVALHGSTVRRHPRQQDRRARPHARLCVRRSRAASCSRSWRSRFSTGWSPKSSSPNG